MTNRGASMSLDATNERLLKKIVAKKLLKESDAALLLNEKANTQQTLVETILHRKLVTEESLCSFLANEFKCPIVKLSVFIPSQEALNLIPASFAHKNRVIPVSFENRSLTVAMERPDDLQLIDDLQAITDMRIRVAVAFPSEMTRALERYYGAKGAPLLPPAGESIEDLIRIVQESKASEREVKTVELLKQAQETPVIKIANLLMVEAIRRRASDLFIEPWENSVRVRCRVDGLLEEVPPPPKAVGSALVSRFKVMSQLDIAERRIPQDGRFRIRVQNREVDVRVSILPTGFGEKVCLRILDKKAQAQSLERLGFTVLEQDTIKSCAVKPHGMILVTGPTGSGKTTTLYSILKFLDSPEKNITTVEDPVEYQVDGINQVNVRESIGLTFPASLRSILRQDPDIILIGEIRDLTTMDIAIKAALTGHLVLSTLHTNDTATTIARILNMGIEPFLITSSVLMISAQRLVRRLCQECKAEYVPDAKFLKRLELADGKHTFFKPAGCGKCRSSGYAGRSVITELMLLTSHIKDMIVARAGADEIKKAARQEGMNTLRESAIQKALAGETSLDEVFRVTAMDTALAEGDE